jgi:hypothetical protein
VQVGAADPEPLGGEVFEGAVLVAAVAESPGQLVDQQWKLELVAVPVSDLDRAKAFYADQVGFVAEHDHQVNEELRFIQLTPPGSACSISLPLRLSSPTPTATAGPCRR